MKTEMLMIFFALISVAAAAQVTGSLPIEKGGHCQDLSFTDQASYAFNDYYQKDPKHGTCYFDGAAEIAVKDPSTSTCKFPSNSTTTYPPSSSVTRAAVPNLGSFLWGLGFTYLAYVAAQIA